MSPQIRLSKKIRPPRRKPVKRIHLKGGSGKSYNRIADVMTVKGVARFLHCTEQSVRQIPRDELPVRKGPGRWDLFLYDDVIAYLRRSTKTSAGVDEWLSEIERDCLASGSDSGRGRSRKKGAPNAK